MCRTSVSVSIQSARDLLRDSLKPCLLRHHIDASFVPDYQRLLNLPIKLLVGGQCAIYDFVLLKLDHK